MKDVLDLLVEERGGELERKKLNNPPTLEIKASIPFEAGQIFIEHKHRIGAGETAELNEFLLYYEVSSELSWKASLYPEGFSDQVFKFLGAQDIQLGFEDLDPLFMIKSDQPELLRKYLVGSELRERFAQLPGMEFRIRCKNGQLRVELRKIVNPPRPDRFTFIIETFETAIRMLDKVGA